MLLSCKYSAIHGILHCTETLYERMHAGGAGAVGAGDGRENQRPAAAVFETDCFQLASGSVVVDGEAVALMS